MTSPSLQPLLSDRDENLAELKRLEAEISSIKRVIAQGFFEDWLTEEVMADHAKMLEARQEELLELLADDLFDL